MRRRVGPGLALLIALSGAALALSAPAPAVAKASKAKLSKKKAKKAKRYAKKAKKAYRKGNYDDAIAAFELAHDIDDDPKHLFNIGRCYEKQGELFRAMEFVQRYVDQVTDEDEKEDAAELHAILRRKLLKAYGELLLESVPDEAGVRLQSEEGEVRKTKTPVATWLPAGTWKVTVAAPDRQPWEGSLVIVIGETLSQEVALKEVAEEPPDEPEPEPEESPEPVAEAAPDPPKDEAAPASSGDEGGGWGTLAALGAGGALLAAGAVFGVLSGQATDEVQGYKDEPGSGSDKQVQDAIDRSNSHALVANVLLGAGVVAAGVGGYLLMTGDSVAVGVGVSW